MVISATDTARIQARERRAAASLGDGHSVLARQLKFGDARVAFDRLSLPEECPCTRTFDGVKQDFALAVPDDFGPASAGKCEAALGAG